MNVRVVKRVLETEIYFFLNLLGHSKLIAYFLVVLITVFTWFCKGKYQTLANVSSVVSKSVICLSGIQI